MTCTIAVVAHRLGALRDHLVIADPCDGVRAHRVLLVHAVDGVVTEVSAEVCAHHEVQLSTVPEYSRSWKLPAQT